MRATGRAKAAVSPGPAIALAERQTRSLLNWPYRSFGALLPSSPLRFTALHPVLGVHIARVCTSATIYQVPEATLTINSIVAPTTVLLIVVVTTAYLVGAPIAKHHVVAPQGVDVVSKLGAYNLLAVLGAGHVFGHSHPAGHDQHRSHQRKQ